MGFPFFMPAYIPGNVVRIYGCHAVLEEAFRRQHGRPSFPVEFEQLGAKIEFVGLVPGQPNDVAGLTVTPKLQRHGGDSYGYRIERAGKTLVYSTDSGTSRDAEPSTCSRLLRQCRDRISTAYRCRRDVVRRTGAREKIVGVELASRAQAALPVPPRDHARRRALAVLSGDRRFGSHGGDHRVECPRLRRNGNRALSDGAPSRGRSLARREFSALLGIVFLAGASRSCWPSSPVRACAAWRSIR